MGTVNTEELGKSIFNALYEIDTRERSVEKDTGRTKLNYLPWATTYSEVCKCFDDMQYKFKTNTETMTTKIIKTIDDCTTVETTKIITQEIPYTLTDTGLEVRTEVTIKGDTKEMCLPVYDSNFKAMKLEPYTYETSKGSKQVKAATFDDVYKSIMRCFAKNLSMFGIGLNYWTKEDAPESILQMNKIQAECMQLINKKSELSSEAKSKVRDVCIELLPDVNGDPRLCEDLSILTTLKKRLLAIRK